MKILIIEDDNNIVDTIRDFLSEEEPTWNVKGTSFNIAKEKLVSFRPDIVILDIFDGKIDLDNATGEKLHSFVWDKHFCPIVVFSAGIDLTKIEDNQHPFKHFVKKGSESYNKLIYVLRNFQTHIKSINDTFIYIQNNLSDVLRDVAPQIFQEIDTEADRCDAIKRASRRRLAALMDESPNGKTKLVSWEQYIYPPITKNCLLGDVIMKFGGSISEPTDFRIILSPSCDLVKRPEPKIKEILVARCCSVVDGLGKANIKDLKNNSKSRNTIQHILTQGYINSVILLPKLKGKIPSMFADMKDLELVPWNSICDDEESGTSEDIRNIERSDTRYYRVASIDSPFREMISQVYQLVSTRPGLPERDFKSWAKELSADLPE